MIESDNKQQEKWQSRLFWLVSLISFVIVIIRSYTVPYHHDEAATFYFFIQTGDYLPFFAHIDANNHILNSTLGFICFKLFGDSGFSLRLPNTLAFIVLIWGTWRLFKQLQHPLSKSIITGGLLLSFHFITFYSTCRGYGLSMALMVFSVSFFSSYLKNFSTAAFIVFVLFFQLAIASNLILIMVSLPLIFIVLTAQFFNKKINWKIILIHLVNIGMLYYWIKFSFFLQENNALYYGEGLSYYKTTYYSLTRLLSGNTSMIVAYAGSAVLILMMLFSFKKWYELKFSIKKSLDNFSLVMMFTLCSLIIGFYSLKKIMGVNYPEDRTGLFFYVFFVLALAFVVDQLSFKYNRHIALLIIVVFIGHYGYALNFRKHSLVNYETIPQAFYDYLVNEQKQHKERITIGGHRVRELIYAFYNYQNGGELNPMDDSDFLHMNADYALALKNEKGYYQNYYDEVLTEPDWNFVLLKRKFPITRKLILDKQLGLKCTGNAEFYNILPPVTDTVIANQKPILAEFDFKIINKDVPNRAWIVMQMDTLNAHYYYKRIPLNWLHYKWDESKTYTYSFASGPINKKLNNMVFYVYNHRFQQIEVEFKAVRLYELHGKGVEVVSKVVN